MNPLHKKINLTIEGELYKLMEFVETPAHQRHSSYSKTTLKNINIQDNLIIFEFVRIAGRGIFAEALIEVSQSTQRDMHLKGISRVSTLSIALCIYFTFISIFFTFLFIHILWLAIFMAFGFLVSLYLIYLSLDNLSKINQETISFLISLC